MFVAVVPGLLEFLDRLNRPWVMDHFGKEAMRDCHNVGTGEKGSLDVGNATHAGGDDAG